MIIIGGVGKEKGGGEKRGGGMGKERGISAIISTINIKKEKKGEGGGR